MPQKLKRPCGRPGCAELTLERYCEQHAKVQRKQNEQRRGSAAQRGYDHRWRQRRLLFLQKHPLCLECFIEEKLTPATVVDHIIPHKGDKALFWDESNWQPLCKSHHDIKTAKEDGGFGR